MYYKYFTMTNNKQPSDKSTNTDDPCDDVCGPELSEWIKSKKDKSKDKHPPA